MASTKNQEITFNLKDLPIDQSFTASNSKSIVPKSFEIHDATFVQEEQRYLFEHSLGEGAYGKVWKAKDNKIGRTVALKSFKSVGLEGVWLCQSEINRTGRLDHPGIPTIYDAGQKDGSSYFTMKYIEGKTLKIIIDELRKENPETHMRFPFIKRADIIQQLLRTLCDLHDCQIVHRDIKPENIIIDKNGHAYLMDWGIALDLTEGTGKEELCGTPKYMSPEQCEQAEIDGRCDLYSLAVTFYELLSLTYYAPKLATAFAYVEQIPIWNPPRVDHIKHPANKSYVPSEYRGIIHKALEKDPKDRFPSAHAMLQELENIQNGEICSICVRTTIKRNINSYLILLDWNPYIIVPMSILVLLGTISLSFILGWSLHYTP